VLAGVMHYEITDVHPFADYNGRAARLFTQAVLRFEGVLRQKFFSLERHYSEDKQAYFEALRSVRRNTRNMEKWLAYFTNGLAVEMERTAESVRSLNRQLGVALGGAQVRLTAAQERIVARLLDGPGDTTISRADTQEIAEIGLSQAKSELRALVKADIIQSVGAGPAVRYRLAHRASSSPRRASRWTDEEIRRALLELTTEEPGRFPSRARFAAKGRLDLSQAMSRAGGIRRWRDELGLTHR
jgi:Fic family protein